MNTNLYSKALSYAVQGYSIIPLKKDKKPLINSWIDFQKTPASDSIIEGWWLRNPSANIGIVTGKISGITVVDIDVKGDVVVPLDTFPPTFTVRTPSGGYHLYYQYDPDIKQTANTYPQFPHVDIRNDGGYVVGPGSDNGQGSVYSIVDKQTPKAFPRELFLGKQGALDVGGKTKTPLAKKIKEIKNLKEGDGRNNAMCSLLGQLLRGQSQQNYPEVRETFLAIARGVPDPLPERELETIWNSIGGRAFSEAHTIDLIVNHKGEPHINIENIRKILVEDPDFAGRCVYDTFLQEYVYHEPNGVIRALHDSDEITITREISVKYKPFAMVNPAVVRSALMEVARNHATDCARDFFNSLKWDGVARLDTWLCNTYNVADNVYYRAVGSNWLKGMARRVCEPGCKFDYVLVLEGKQGTRKSTSLGVLGGAWHVETTASPDNKDFLMLLQGNLIIEFSEGETLSRGEIKQLKALITTQFDKFRAPYERYVQTYPRRCVFAMTTNQTEYLKDETGNRRWLPVATVGDANLEWLRSNREQLFAEALYRVSVLKETTHEFPDEVFEEQAKRQVSDPNEDRIVEWYHTVLTGEQRNAGITIHMAFTGALGMMMSRFNKRDEMEITSVFKNALRLERKRASVGGVRAFRWFAAGMVGEGEEITSMTMAEMSNAF